MGAKTDIARNIRVSISFVTASLVTAGWIAPAFCELTYGGASAQDSYSNPSQSPSFPNLNDPRIIPPSADAVGGGNPFQGLGRPDDGSASRRSQFESGDASTSSLPPAGSVNPNVPPDLPPAQTTDPIELQREKEEKDKELEEQKKAEAKDKEKSSRSPSLAVDTPLKRAMLAMHMRNYDQSLSQLDGIIATNPKNAEAHYLKAVIYVLTRKYDTAASEYRLVLKNDPSPTMSRKARLGLEKLAR